MTVPERLKAFEQDSLEKVLKTHQLIIVDTSIFSAQDLYEPSVIKEARHLDLTCNGGREHLNQLLIKERDNWNWYANKFGLERTKQQSHIQTTPCVKQEIEAFRHHLSGISRIASINIQTANGKKNKKARKKIEDFKKIQENTDRLKYTIQITNNRITPYSGRLISLPRSHRFGSETDYKTMEAAIGYHTKHPFTRVGILTRDVDYCAIALDYLDIINPEQKEQFLNHVSLHYVERCDTRQTRNLNLRETPEKIQNLVTRKKRINSRC